jgi:menaquinone-dependent protoporphyrinogen oxidase
MKEASKLLSKNNDVLSTRTVWLFSSGPVGNERKDAKGRDLLDPSVSGPKELRELVKYSHPLDHRIFFGVLDPSNQGFIYRQMRKSASVRESLPEGDFRNWGEIEAWCTGIAGALEGMPTTMTM